MSRQLRIASLIVLLLAAAAAIAVAATVVLNFPSTNPAQEHSQWCWAAASQAILAYYGTAVSQCAIANHASGYPADPSRPDCCIPSGFSDGDTVLAGCNYWNYLWGSSVWGAPSGSVQGILSHWGVSSAVLVRSLTQQEVIAEIGAGRPAVMRFGWKCSDGSLACGGHFLDIYGQEEDATYLDYWDPWPGNGATRSLYTWVVDASNHQWTHTLRLTTTPGGTIAGAVTYAGTGAPLVGIYVQTFNISGALAGVSVTNGSGVYAVAGLAAGTYYVRTSNNLGFIDELYNNLPCPGGNCSATSGAGVLVTAGTATNNINFALARGGKASDFNGDLHSDLLWHHTARGEVWLWPMDGGLHTESYVSTVGEAGWEVRGLGDQTGDGQADILWRHAATGRIYLWTMNGSTVRAEASVGTVETAFDIVGTGDHNGDGRSDILWRRATTGELWLWTMNGATTQGVQYVDTVDPVYAVRGSGDLNGDGKADLVWQHATQGDVWVWLMNGPAHTSVAWVAKVGELDYRIAGAADYTGDGKADLLWHHATRGDMWLWQMDGAVKVSEAYVATVPETAYRIAGAGDYDGDGKADILWHHATRGEVWVWLMNGATKVSQHYVGAVPDTGYRVVK